MQIAERQLSSQHSDSLDESAGSHSTIYSIQTRMEQHRGSSSGAGPCATMIDRNAPKIVRVLGEGPLAHHSQHHPPPHHHPPLPVPPHHQLATAAAHHHHLPPPPPHQEEYAHPHLQQHPSSRSTIFEEQEDILIAEGIHIRNTSGSRASGVLSTGGGIGADDPISSSSIGTSTAFVDNVYMTTRGAQQQQQQKKIKFKRGLIDPGIPPGLCSSTTKLPVTPVHGIFRSPNRDSPDVDDEDVVVIERPCSSASSRGGLAVPGPSTSSQAYVARRVEYQGSRDYEVDETELGEDIAEGPGGGGGDGGSDSSYELYSPLDRANLKDLSKSQVIAMWRTSEMDLRRQLSQALKARDELAHKLKKPELHDPP